MKDEEMKKMFVTAVLKYFLHVCIIFSHKQATLLHMATTLCI